MQAENPQDSEHTSQVQSSGFDASLLQIKYNVDKVKIFREALCNLLEPVFGVADPSCCLATALQSCISHAALANSGPLLVALASTNAKKQTRSGMMQSVKLHVLP